MAGDIYYNNVSLLLHCDGTNGSTTFTDNSPTPKTITPSGDAKISTAQSKFGSASALFDGTGDYLTASGNTDFSFGTGDFTIEFWLYHTTGGSYQIVYTGSGNVDAGNLWIELTNSGQVIVGVGSNNFFNGFGSVPLNTWTHIAVSKSSGVYYVFVNGVQPHAAVADTTSIVCATGYPAFGGHFNSAGYIGYIDDIRVTKGIARYTSNFTPQTTAFADSLPKQIVGSVPLITAVLATFNRKHQIIGTMPITTTVVATVHKQLKFSLTGSVPLTVNPASPAHRRVKYFITETVAITTVVAASLKKYHHSAIVGAIPVTTSVNAVLLEQHRNQIIGSIPLTLTPAATMGGLGLHITGGGFNSYLLATFSPFQNLAITGAGFTSALSCDFGGHIEGGGFTSTLESTLTGIPSFFIEGGSFTTTLDSAITYETLINVTGLGFSSSLDANFGANVEGGGFTSSLSAELTGWASFSVNGGAFNSAVNIGITGSTSINVTGGGFKSQLLWMNVEGGGFKTELKANILVLVGNAVAYVLNIHSTESYQWSNMGFSHIICIGGKNYGVKTDGLYLLEGATDSGTAIDGYIIGKDSDMGSADHSQRVPKVLLNSDCTTTTVQPIVDGVTKNVHTVSYAGREAKLGRGYHGRYWQFKVSGIVKLEGIHYEPEKLQRFVK